MLKRLAVLMSLLVSSCLQVGLEGNSVATAATGQATLAFSVTADVPNAQPGLVAVIGARGPVWRSMSLGRKTLTLPPGTYTILARKGHLRRPTAGVGVGTPVPPTLSSRRVTLAHGERKWASVGYNTLQKAPFVSAPPTSVHSVQDTGGGASIDVSLTTAPPEVGSVFFAEPAVAGEPGATVRVESITQSRQGRYVIRGADATILDAFPYLDVRRTVQPEVSDSQISPSAAGSPCGGSRANPILDPVNVPHEPLLEIHLKLNDGLPDREKIYFKLTYTRRIETATTIGAGAQIFCSIEQSLEAQKGWLKLPGGRAGAVPVFFGGGLVASLQAQSEAYYTWYAGAKVTAALEYKNGKASTDIDLTEAYSDMVPNSPTCVGSVTAHLKPQLSFGLGAAGLLGVELEIKTPLIGKIEPTQNPWWSVRGGYSITSITDVLGQEAPTPVLEVPVDPGVLLAEAGGPYPDCEAPGPPSGGGEGGGSGSEAPPPYAGFTGEKVGEGWTAYRATVPLGSNTIVASNYVCPDLPDGRQQSFGTKRRRNSDPDSWDFNGAYVPVEPGKPLTFHVGHPSEAGLRELLPVCVDLGSPAGGDEVVFRTFPMVTVMIAGDPSRLALSNVTARPGDRITVTTQLPKGMGYTRGCTNLIRPEPFKSWDGLCSADRTPMPDGSVSHVLDIPTDATPGEYIVDYGAAVNGADADQFVNYFQTDPPAASLTIVSG